MSDQGNFLIEKHNLYYKPESAGYTGLKSNAGRYSFEEAAEIVGPNGPDGSRDGMEMWREEDAPEYSSGCAWDIKMKDQAYRQGWADCMADSLNVVGCYIKQEANEECPDCQRPLKEFVCPDKSCTQCLGLHGGFVCEACRWFGDFDDLFQQQM